MVYVKANSNQVLGWVNCLREGNYHSNDDDEGAETDSKRTKKDNNASTSVVTPNNSEPSSGNSSGNTSDIDIEEPDIYDPIATKDTAIIVVVKLAKPGSPGEDGDNEDENNPLLQIFKECKKTSENIFVEDHGNGEKVKDKSQKIKDEKDVKSVIEYINKIVV